LKNLSKKGTPMAAGSRGPSRPLKDDLIWRLDDENPSHEIEVQMFRDLGYGNFVVTRSRAFREEFPRYASKAKGILLQISFPRLGEELLEKLTSCRVVSVTGGGYNNVDVEAAARLGIIVTYVPGYCVGEVSDHVLALILSLNQRIGECRAMTREGEWTAANLGLIKRLRNCTLGIVGLGRIGETVARKARCLGLSVKVYDPYVSGAGKSGLEVEYVGLEELARESDFISLHVPLTPETRHLISARILGLMKETVYIVNTCRGEVIDEQALIEALRKKKIAGAGLDVLTQEPPDPANPLLSMPNVIVTPHSAFVSREARLECKSRAIRAVVDAIEGRVPEDIIDRRALEAR
jgi:D-3-phosphoglycerate dehydrogenase